MIRVIRVTAALALCVAAWGDTAREDVLTDGLAHWSMGAAPALKTVGKIEFGADAGGKEHKCARLSEAYFDAGKDLTVQGDAITVYLRVRDPRGQWAYALFNKRGNHDVVNFNLFSVDLGGTPGPDIGFELHSDAGFVMVNFPVSEIDPTAWHDFVGRYDGKTIEMICDGKVMAKKLWKGGGLTQNTEPVLLGAETDNGKIIRLFTGEMEEAALWPRALSDTEVARLMRKEAIMPDHNYVEPYASPIHYRPEVGRLADTIPFFWKGEYHIFYLRAIDKVPWEHIVSPDLIHWKELPTALKSDGPADGPDGLHMFTGSVAEREGAFHIFYTGWNPANPQGREWVMHATSPDLITWTKHREAGFRGDGIHYQNSDFRDPFVFLNPDDQRYWMLMCARDAKTGKPVQGVAQSKDLTRWEQLEPLILDPPLGEGTPECPDLFKIDDTYYLIHSPSAGTTDMRYAKDIRGPYRPPASPNIDTPILYAAKRMFDGKRHIITGWIRDLGGDRDGGGFEWGGDQCVPREVYAGPVGQLCFRPAPEAVAVFQREILNFTEKSIDKDSPELFLEVPDNYMMQCRARLDPNAEFAVIMREQQKPGSGYRLILRPQTQEAEISGTGFHFARKIALDTAKPIGIQAFVQGSIIECFIDDAYAFSCRAYNCRTGRLGFSVSSGKLDILDLSVKTHESAR